MTRLFRHGFVRASRTDLVDDDGRIPLRGIGLGNWLLPEGYMWRFEDEYASPRQIEARVLDLVGPARAAEFWTRFRAEFVADADFAMIAEWGFDHVRLPINARGVMTDDGDLIEQGFAVIERAVASCEAHGLRILLDLHGAPGGQTGTNIDDSRDARPELFTDAGYRAQTIDLWRELALRYRDREAVLGYDLLNEPLPNEWQHRYEDELVQLYRDLTVAIREVDDRHLLMYEGSHWATNWSPLGERFDDNQVLQFHRYWCSPDESSIEDFLAVRDALGTPIYMGEGGENTPEWIYAMTRLYERHGIGWNFWPWKKLDTVTSPLSIRRPAGWDRIADPACRPEPADAWRILGEYLGSISAEQCVRHPEIIDALFARPSLRIPAWAGTQHGTSATASSGPLAELPTALWEHPFGEPYDADDHPVVPLGEGDRLAFALSEAPARWEVESDTPGAVETHWNGREVVLEASADVRIRALSLTRTGTVEP